MIIKDYFNQKIDARLAIGLLFGLLILAFSMILSDFKNLIDELYNLSIPSGNQRFYTPEIRVPFTPGLETREIKKFSSAEEFKNYIAEAVGSAGGYGAMGRGGMATDLAAPQAMMEKSAAPSPGRISETTVQVAGIDEPDIVKTDGKEIYFSPGQAFRIFWERGISLQSEMRMMPPYYETQGIKTIKAFPPADLAVEGKIDKSGNLLLIKNILAVFSDTNNEIIGYDVSDAKSPKEKWKIKLENNSSLAGARLYKDKIYLVVKNTINESRPCPLQPLSINDKSLVIECSGIYHPSISVPVDITFTAMILNPDSGKTENNISFVGSSGQSLVYMSENGIYITYSYTDSVIRFFTNFLKEKGEGLVPAWLTQKTEKLDGYDISQQAKFLEFQLVWEKYINSLNEDERLRVSNELENRMNDYYKEHKRDLEKTGIVKIGLDGFRISAIGNVPGVPLNQFSLDEYNDYLRIATTIGGGSLWAMGMASGESANDVYVLDKDMNIAGSVKDLGKTERIYSVRFINDRGYVVTFRNTDPFYVLDLSNPRKPEMKGELKIPGYSSYLHPIGEDKILGIGKENANVKISLFDVSDAKNPKETDKYTLDEYWTDVMNNYHAFLLDGKHNIFFLPGGKGGYVFSYEGGQKLSLKKAVSQFTARRAIYLDDYLYIIGDSKITVLNENTWEKVKELEF